MDELAILRKIANGLAVTPAEATEYTALMWERVLDAPAEFYPEGTLGAEVKRLQRDLNDALVNGDPNMPEPLGILNALFPEED